ncbi:hypothetical protein PQH03_29405 [Ralstonia insidiosa]|uniref:Uncharacterized protein n=1 Tax=Ralstonia insidiosa TaxID=190721 RepID=A0A848P7H3_9RALS|nr:hypothetical protein [Ralstonia insidiosa]MDE4928771.1 hypothetical protein [Ralstonia insidiosa]NMV41143.1 hypothetical protein [Ralstonia insidiosa]
MQLLRHLLAAAAFVLALCIFPLACMALAWPETPLVGVNGCFWSPNFMEAILLYPLQEHPLAFTLATGAVLLLASLSMAASLARRAMEAWRAARSPAIDTTKG